MQSLTKSLHLHVPRNFSFHLIIWRDAAVIPYVQFILGGGSLFITMLLEAYVYLLRSLRRMFICCVLLGMNPYLSRSANQLFTSHTL